MKVTFHLDGKDYDFDPNRLNVGEMRLAKVHLGLASRDIEEWETLLLNGDVDAFVLMILIAKRRAGEKVEWADFDDWEIDDLLASFKDSLERAQADLAAAAAATSNGKTARAPRKPKSAEQPEPAAS